MKEWLYISCLLCIFGFVREIRPSEPYITEYLLGPWHNLTEDQLLRDVYPVGTYSHLIQLVFVFLITDFLRYKPLIITIGATGVIIWSMLIWTKSLLALQIIEIFYGTYMAAEVAYYTYIYAKVEKKYYPQVTSHTRAAMFAGKLVSGITSQIMINCGLMDYKKLNYITLATQIVALLWAFVLPRVERSLYFNYKNNVDLDTRVAATHSETVLENDANSVNSQPNNHVQPNGVQLLWKHLQNYTNPRVFQWSLWYAMGFAGYLQVTYYVQVLWKVIEPNPSIAWNGAVDAVLTALAALSALSAGYIHAGRFKPRASLFLLAILSMLEGGCVLLSCWTTNIYWSYVGFVTFGALYGFTITVASAEVARNLQEDSFGLVFGINSLIALIFQSLLTIVVISESGFALPPVRQFTVYAFYFISVGIIYFISVSMEYILLHSNSSKIFTNDLQ